MADQNVSPQGGSATWSTAGLVVRAPLPGVDDPQN